MSMPPVAPSLRPLDDLGDLAGLEAAGADLEPFDLALDQRAQGDEVNKPASLGDVVSVTDLVTHRRAFSADITMGHPDSSRVNVVGRTRPLLIA